MSDEEDYEHWSEEDKHSIASTSHSAGYDRFNGLRQWDYLPANIKQKEGRIKSEVSKSASKSPPPVAAARCSPPRGTPQALDPPQQMVYMVPGYPQMLYGLPQQFPMACPAPAYYGYPAGPPPYGSIPVPNDAWISQPASGIEQKVPEPKKKEKPEVKKWQGRTKAEVEEDNMKIALREGACAPRKVEPKGLADDQMIWCIEPDTSPTLRTYATVKGFEGEWKADPRFKDSWYFVRMAETSD